MPRRREATPREDRILVYQRSGGRKTIEGRHPGRYESNHQREFGCGRDLCGTWYLEPDPCLRKRRDYPEAGFNHRRKRCQHWLKTGMCPLRPTPVNGYVCDYCGGLFKRKDLDAHFEKLAREAARIQGVAWSGDMVTFGASERAWCPTCFPDAESSRRGGRTVHVGQRQPYYPSLETDMSYSCKCGKINKFNSKEVSVFTGLEVLCDACGKILFVPPSIFNHSVEKKKAIIRNDWRSLVSYR